MGGAVCVGAGSHPSRGGGPILSFKTNVRHTTEWFACQGAGPGSPCIHPACFYALLPVWNPGAKIDVSLHRLVILFVLSCDSAEM